MKKLFFLLFMMASAIGYSHVNCTTMGVVTAGLNELEISLPTTNDCNDPTHEITMSTDGGAFSTPNFTIDPLTGNALIVDLKPCTEYVFRIPTFCDGEIVGGCQSLPYSTACPDCECINYLGVEVVAQIECEVTMVMDFNVGDCGEIQVLDASWDFGYPGGTGSGELVTHEFPSNGTYTVSGTLTFEIVGTGEVCEVTRSAEVTVDHCNDPCDCVDVWINTFSQDECEVVFGFDFDPTSCTPWTFVSGTWDFGYPGGTGTGKDITHNFPSNGSYLVTAEYTYLLFATGEECTVTVSTVVEITDCTDPCNCVDVWINTFSQDECEVVFGFDFDPTSCTPWTFVSGTWDFGYPGGTGTGKDITHNFPSNGTYTVTAEYTYFLFATGEECTVIIDTEVVITDCHDPCDCVDVWINTFSQDECEVVFGFDFDPTSCTPWTFVSGTWDFGYPGGTGTGKDITHNFPSNGTYLVTAEYTYLLFATGEECTVTVSTVVEITDCNDMCDCVDVWINTFNQKDCEVGFGFGFDPGICGAWIFDSAIWDFGYPGGTGTGKDITHEFPGDGTYTVTAAYTFRFFSGLVCTVIVSTQVVIENCDDENDDGGHGGKRNSEQTLNVTMENPTSFITDLTARPNPFNDVVDLVFNLTNDELVNINVIDTQGKLVYSNEANFAKGNNTQQVDMSNLASGVYFYTLETLSGKLSGKLIKK